MDRTDIDEKIDELVQHYMDFAKGDVDEALRQAVIDLLDIKDVLES